MPEYLYPGVYVEEIDAGVMPIAGVATSDPRIDALAAEFRRAMKAHVPEWAGGAEGDPGVTILELFGFLAEDILWRSGAVSERARESAARAAAALASLAGASGGNCGGLVRPAFFSGQLLDAATLTAEQDYHREKLRRHNRALHGSGIVSGLGVRLERDVSGTDSVHVDPGFAIDANGEEIGIPRPVSIALPSNGPSTFVTLRFWERPCSAASIEEACVLGLAPSAAPPVLPLARLARTPAGWQIDPAFSPPRAR